MKIRPFGKDKVQADAGVVLGRRTKKVFDTKRDAEIWLKNLNKVRAEDRLGLRRLSRDHELLALTAFEELGQHHLDQLDQFGLDLVVVLLASDR